MIEFLRLIFYILAVFRITILLSKDNGPWDIFDWVRYRLGVRTTLDPLGNPEVVSDRILGRIIMCSNCLSFYILIAIGPLYLLNISIIDYAVYFLGCWGIVLLLSLNYEKYEKS